MADIWHHNDDGIWCISCGEIIRAPWQSAPPPDECPTCGFPDDEMVAEYHAGEDVSEFEMLLACYRSGQVSERQWQEHLRDREFREWVEARAALAKSEAVP